MEKLMTEVRVPWLKTESNCLKLVIFKLGLSVLLCWNHLVGISLNVGLDDLWGPFVTDRMLF